MAKKMKNVLMSADEIREQKGKLYRTIPTTESPWWRIGHQVRIKLSQIEPGLPDGLDARQIKSWRLVRFDGKAWHEIPLHLDLADGFERWTDAATAGLDAALWFDAPVTGICTDKRWPGAAAGDVLMPLMLWDSWHQSRCEGLFLVAGMSGDTACGTASGPLAFRETPTGLAVMRAGECLATFDPRQGYQLVQAAVPGAGTNLIDPGRTWRWLPTEAPAELAAGAQDTVTFEPIVASGSVLVANIGATNSAGRMTATLRIFEQSGALVLEFSDYRTIRTRPEFSEADFPRHYAGHRPSPYPDRCFAALCVDAGMPGSRVFDHFYKYGPVAEKDGLQLVYPAYPINGFAWMALEMPGGCAGIAAHGRTHEPDYPWLAGTVDGRRILALEPFGSTVDGHFHSCDRYMLILAPSVGQVRRLFERLDTFPILARVPLRKAVPVLDVFERIGRWVNLNLDCLLKDGTCRNALLTDGTLKDDAPTCMAAVGELMRLHEKTGHRRFLDEAVRAADVVAAWIEAGRFGTRGDGLGPNGGGIYQSEQIYLLLSLARVARATGSARLRKAIATGVAFMLDNRGGRNTWGWTDYPWHAGSYGPNGKPMGHWWPVNTNAFGALCFRLYQLLGERAYYDHALAIMEDYLRFPHETDTHIVRGGGVSDTTRGVHFFTEAIEVAGDDPRVDVPRWRERIAETLERFWVNGWVLLRNSIYAEVIRPGDDAPECFSPGLRHCHNTGSFLDILPRIQIAAEAGVSEHLTRWAARDLALEFDLRYGMEEHTHFTRFGIRDTDIEPASGLDPELLSTMWPVRRNGWIDDTDYALYRYKVHRMMLETFIALDETHGGWAAVYDVAAGKPIRSQNQECAFRHAHERFAPGEPFEMWGVAAREAYHDHSTHYWAPMEQFVDALAKVEATSVENGVQRVRMAADGVGAGIDETMPLLVPKAPGVNRLELDGVEGAALGAILEARTVTIGGQPFWLALCRTP